MVRWIHIFSSLLLCLARHLTAVGLLTLAAGLLWTLVYGGLLLFALLTDGRIGGPLAYPVGLLLILIPCLVIGAGIFAPACGIGLLVTSLFRLPRLAAIPVVFVSGFGLLWLISGLYSDFVTTSSRPALGSLFWSYLLFLSLPLGLYWWLTEGPWAILDLLHRLWTRYRPRVHLRVQHKPLDSA